MSGQLDGWVGGWMGELSEVNETSECMYVRHSRRRLGGGVGGGECDWWWVVVAGSGERWLTVSGEW